MNKILVPVDFSETSLNALSYAIQLFGSSPIEITVLHIYGAKSNAALLMKSIDSILEKDARSEMDELIQKVRKEHPDITLSSKIIKNYAISAIASLGDSGNYDFIVMGTKGVSGLKEVFIGSIAGGVISKTTAPVIVVPAAYSFHPLNEIVFALGKNPFFSTTVVDPLRKIATMHQSKIKVLHIADKKTPDMQEATNILSTIKDLNPSMTYRFGTGNTNQDLNDYLMKHQSGLLCLVRSKKGFFDRILNESVTLKQTFNSPVPLLILHD
ncbi:universal stress protein [Flavivirga abyssicola]|uniref:universal stress protein n=1 Tax=Flavivirga abyssicola TaxID=3063533 RepID=UPI0026DEA905|nr:universal stress protein [Flavivirga sp. MEBiC07777]WVK12366.1 universal stress protein [Flavivirga sp. MEBiC07777]